MIYWNVLFNQLEINKCSQNFMLYWTRLTCVTITYILFLYSVRYSTSIWSELIKLMSIFLFHLIGMNANWYLLKCKTDTLVECSYSIGIFIQNFYVCSKLNIFFSSVEIVTCFVLFIRFYLFFSSEMRTSILKLNKELN